MASVARMERAGVPIDQTLHRKLVQSWPDLKQDVIGRVDADFGVYDGTTFKADRFARLLTDWGIPWPRHASGALKLDDDTFGDQADRWPELSPLRELRATLGKMRLIGLAVGSDGRNRCLLSPFAAKTGRNQPSTNEFIFGPARWMRGLIRPAEGYGIAYVDFSSQEIGIAAALSGDPNMIEGYVKGDPYLAFAKQIRMVPPDATAQSHKMERDRCKSVVLGVNYGMGAETMAIAAGVTPIEARELLRLHRQTYGRFWRWSENVIDAAVITGRIQTVFGWPLRVGSDTRPTSLMNFPMQANGAEMMRIAAIGATEAGIEVCAPVHDAFLIAAPLERLDADVEQMRSIMSQAGSAVTGGLDIRTDAKVVRCPDRYMDERGQKMWNRVMAALNNRGATDVTDTPVIKRPRPRCRTGAKVVSHQCEPGPSNYISYNIPYSTPHGPSRRSPQPGVLETEIETDVSRRARTRHQGRFLKGPIPMAKITAAAVLPGKALALFLAIHHRTALTGQSTVTLPRSLLAELGIGRDAKARGLRDLEAAGLVHVERARGHTARVGLISKSSSDPGEK